MQEASPAATPSAQVVGNAFVEQYYHILHQSPNLVHRFYLDSSFLSRSDSNGVMTTVTTTKVSLPWYTYIFNSFHNRGSYCLYPAASTIYYNSKCAMKLLLSLWKCVLMTTFSNSSFWNVTYDASFLWFALLLLTIKWLEVDQVYQTCRWWYVIQQLWICNWGLRLLNCYFLVEFWLN